jgi:hypothetical protein
VHFTPITGDIKQVDVLIKLLLDDADAGTIEFSDGPEEPWAYVVYLMLKAHQEYRLKRVDLALEILSAGDQSNDWITAGREWLVRRGNQK